jgi:methyl-accepting chemotaxis protein
VSEQNAGAQLRVRLGTVELRETGATELRLIAKVSEAIKQSIDASGKIGLVAVNANLVAGRAGDRAAGFCVVAGELRRFSDGMAKSMQGWSKLIYELVRETAHSRNQARSLVLLRATGRCSPKAQEAIAAACERSRSALDVFTQGNSARVIELQGLIHRAEKQRVTGEVIARSALIESAYGGAMQQILQQIAKEIDSGLGEFISFSRKVGETMGRVSA